MDPKIIILSEAFGAGHTKVAEAVKEGIKLTKPDWQVDVIELSYWLRPHLSRALSQAYLKTLQYSPRLWGLMYQQSIDKPVMPKIEFLLHRVLYTRIMHFIHTYQPSLIICTHPFPSTVISRLKRMGLNIPLYTIVTDFAIHSSWISDKVDRYFIPSPKLTDELVLRGIKHSQIFPMGIPLHPHFWSKNNKQTIRHKLGLANKPTILCMGGSLGMGISNEFLHALLPYHKEIQFIIVAGKNKSLFQSIQTQISKNKVNVQLYEYVDHIHELMDAADLILTKPGGVTCAESIIKRLPMLVVNPIPGQEERNLHFMMEERAGVLIQNPTELKHVLNKFPLHPEAVTSQFHVQPFFAANGVVDELIHSLS